jgi:uncharacterized membrane protein
VFFPGWWLTVRAAAGAAGLVADVWACLRRWLGGRTGYALMVVYVAAATFWVGVGWPGGWPVAVVLGVGYVLLMVAGWVERRAVGRGMPGVDERVAAESADLDGRWRDIRADAAWVRDGPPEP